MTSSPTRTPWLLWLASGLGCITLAAGWQLAVYAISSSWNTQPLLLAAALFALHMYFISKLVAVGYRGSTTDTQHMAHQVLALLLLSAPIVCFDNATPELSKESLALVFMSSALSIITETMMLSLLFSAILTRYKERESVE